MKDNKGKSLDHLLISKDDFEYRVGYDDSSEAMEQARRIAKEHFGGNIPSDVNITHAVKWKLMLKQSTHDRMRGKALKKKPNRTLEYYFINTSLIELLAAQFGDIGGREFVILLLALKNSDIIRLPERGKNSMYECFRTKFRNIGTDSVINTYLSAYIYGKDMPSKQAITEAEVSKMQETLAKLIT